jgi:hypothetical protein
LAIANRQSKSVQLHIRKLAGLVETKPPVDIPHHLLLVDAKYPYVLSVHFLRRLAWLVKTAATR